MIKYRRFSPGLRSRATAPNKACQPISLSVNLVVSQSTGDLRPPSTHGSLSAYVGRALRQVNAPSLPLQAWSPGRRAARAMPRQSGFPGRRRGRDLPAAENAAATHRAGTRRAPRSAGSSRRKWRGVPAHFGHCGPPFARGGARPPGSLRPRPAIRRSRGDRQKCWPSNRPDAVVLAAPCAAGFAQTPLPSVASELAALHQAPAPAAADFPRHATARARPRLRAGPSAVPLRTTDR